MSSFDCTYGEIISKRVDRAMGRAHMNRAVAVQGGFFILHMQGRKEREKSDGKCTFGCKSWKSFFFPGFF